ncbi:MAG TPA: heavy metal-associated domain-containing protein, partial [Burkholderiaceae bacterium]|nr:heavy metal-associated domain-containing protein [Burkholderiaceae bacterium]
MINTSTAAARVTDAPTSGAARAAEAGVGEATLRFGGMHCAACALAIEGALLGVPGVLSARVSAASGYGSVR